MLNNVYNLFCLIWIFFFLFPLIQSFGLKGCSWRPLPAHFRFADWHNNGIFEFASSRASVWSAVLFLMLFGLNFLCAFCIGSSHARKTTWSLSISPKMKTIHLLTRNVQIIAQSWINIWCGIPWLKWWLPLFEVWTHRGNWGAPGWSVSRPWAPFFSNLWFKQTNFVRLPFLNE